MAEEAPAARPPRLGFCLIVTASVAMFYGLCHVAAGYETIFSRLEMKSLPLPTEVFIALARLVRTPVGGILVFVHLLLLIALALRGRLDPVLKTLMIVHIVAVPLLLGFFTLSLHVPIAQIQRNLENR